ncbi:MAG: patatin-like phospholipase family protein [Dehalococcoidia bacterium]
MMDSQDSSIFDGVPIQELAPELAKLRRRSYAAGQILIEEGEIRPRTILVIVSGTAEAFLKDRHGGEHPLGRLAPGASLGEMAMLSGDPASATVRAVTDVAVLEVDEEAFHRLATRFPRIYLNIGIQLADRLARANRRSLAGERARVTVAIRRSGAPLAGYALACSIAWHTRKPVLTMVIEREHNDAIERLAARVTAPADVPRSGEGGGPGRASLSLSSPVGVYAPERLPATIEDLRSRYGHIVVQISESEAAALGEGRQVYLWAADGRADGTDFPVRVWNRTEGRASGFQHLIDIPALSTAEEEAVVSCGTLSPDGRAGRAIGRWARDAAGLRVGLALGAGAIKGYAHIGTLRALGALGVPVDFIAGTSIGAAVAGMHAAGYSPERAAAALDMVGALAFRPTLPRRSLLSSDALREGLRRVAQDTRIEHLPVPLAVVAADMITQSEVVFRRGPVWQAVLASMSIPGIYPAQAVGNRLLVDGGVLNPVPTNVVTDMGADVVIAVKLASPPATSGRFSAAATGNPSLIQSFVRTLEVMQSRITSFTTATATVVLEPAFPPGQGWGLRNFSGGRRFISLGEQAVVEARGQIAAALPWVT